MVKDSYSYLFHCSEYRSKEKRWACYHVEDESFYWNGSGPDKYGVVHTPRISYGKDPNDAWSEMKNTNEKNPIV